MTRPIRTLLVANRGEIARRVFRTCRTMGISTVAVFSDPDRHTPFVGEADRAVALGGSSPTESYLRAEKVVAAALATGADAIHPGYGFLSENAEFAEAVVTAGLIWVGPPPDAIRAMGSKLESKRLITEAGVPTLPSTDLGGLDAAAVAEAAAGIGYPVLVKASAGGGGKGMRIVHDEAGLSDAVESARREAGSAFGDDTLFLERYLRAPRHIEIQVFADDHGNTVSLFERECSIQRRHQKIIEESPSPAISDEVRRQMGEAAVAAAEAVGYRGAGTVEFLHDGDGYFFLEMNTRLQVEHPVTEAITGLDLVRLQLLVAEGRPLPPEAQSPVGTGHAIEARLYAEDPRNDFLPVTGRLERFRFPSSTGIRLDSGVEDGSVVSVHYDPMLAKVIARADTRQEAALLLAAALRRAEIHGMVTNRELLVRVLEHPEFLAGDTDTGFLERHDPSELSAPLADHDEARLAALAVALYDQARRRSQAVVTPGLPSGFRNNPSDLQRTRFHTDHGDISVGYRFDARSGLLVAIDDDPAGPAEVTVDGERVGVERSGLLTWFLVHRSGDTAYAVGPSGTTRLVETQRFPGVAIEDDPGSLHAPMPGKVIKVAVAPGDAVEEGQLLVVLEAMKMEHALRSPVAGTVHEVRAAEGDQVEADAVLVVVEE